MRFDSFAFIGFSILAAVSIQNCPPGTSKRLLIALANALFLASFVDTAVDFAPLLLFVAVGYLAILSSRRALAILVSAIIALFAWLKQYDAISFLPKLEFSYITVGLSYVLFRILHLMVDVAQGTARKPTPLEFWNYALFFPCFVSGPIQRFQDFSQQANSSRPLTVSELIAAIDRMLLGYAFILVIAPIVLYYSNQRQLHLYDGFSTVRFAAAAAIYFLYLYFNFSGYIHIVIGIGRLAGFELPENFREPFDSVNFLDFWTRWNITLADWFRYYLFNPLTKLLVKHWGTSVSLPYLGAIAFFCTFLTMGVWHGTSGTFVIYGLLLGSGVTVNKLWQVSLTKRLGKKGYRRLADMAPYRAFSRATALSYFAIVLSCIWFDPKQAHLVLSLSGLRVAFGAFCFLTLCSVAAILAIDGIKHLRKGAVGRIPKPADVDSGLALAALTAAKVFALVVIVSFLQPAAPEFVYKAF